MMQKFYLAATRGRDEESDYARSILDGHGFHCVRPKRISHKKFEHPSVMKDLALEEMTDVKNAGFIVVLLSENEDIRAIVGMAIAMEKPVFLCANPASRCFAVSEIAEPLYWHPGCIRIEAQNVVDQMRRVAETIASWRKPKALLEHDEVTVEVPIIIPGGFNCNDKDIGPCRFFMRDDNGAKCIIFGDEPATLFSGGDGSFIKTDACFFAILQSDSAPRHGRGM